MITHTFTQRTMPQSTATAAILTPEANAFRAYPRYLHQHRHQRIHLHRHQSTVDTSSTYHLSLTSFFPSAFATHAPSLRDNRGTYIGRARGYSSSSASPPDPYRLLGVSRSATAQEIKIAYFKAAKACHPDTNPGDKDAKVKFQQLAEAYSLLSDPTKRKEYDSFGHRSNYNGGDARRDGFGGFTGGAEDIFRGVGQDAEVVKKAVEEYFDEVQEDIKYMMKKAREGDWAEVWNVAKANKGLIFFGVAVPAVILRFPAAIMVAANFLIVGGRMALMVLIRTGNTEAVMKWVWANLVKIAKERKRRSSSRIRK